ncbi:hypothetical protein VTK56DRAFT_8445 [Thermocarpiscus australiensis]
MSSFTFFAGSSSKGLLTPWVRSGSHRLLASLAVVVFLLFIPVFLPANSLITSVEKDITARSTVLKTRDLGGENASSPKALLLARSGDPSSPTWVQRVATGRMLWCLMNNPNAAQSTWVWDDLERWGWEELSLTASNIEEWQEPLSAAYAAYGITASNDVGYGYMNSEDFLDANGNEQEATFAGYQNLVNGKDGSIVAGYNWSPAEQYRNMNGVPPPSQNALPQLGKWSDVVALQWQRHAAGGTIQYIFRSNIQNDNTKAMIQHAFLLAGQTSVPTYPGYDFTVDADGSGGSGDAFYGLLGTYHGAGPAYMLAQHQGLFGQRRIRKIKVWNQQRAWPTDGSQNYDELAACFMLFVEAVPAQ